MGHGDRSLVPFQGGVTEFIIFRKNTIIIDLNILFVPFAASMLFFGYMALFLMAWFSILIHELGHIMTAYLFGRRTFVFKILPVGFAALFEEGWCSRCQRILVYISGPFANLVVCLAAAVFYNFCPTTIDAIKHYSVINLTLGLFNLLPVYPLDGSRIMRELLAEYWGFRIGNRYLKRVSFLISGLITVSGLLLLKQSAQGFNLLVIGIYILISIKNDYTGEASIVSIKDMLYRHTRLLKKGIYPVRDLVVLESMQLNSVIKCMDFDRFHIIYVLGKYLNIERICTEKEIMDYVARYGGELTFAELSSKDG